MFVNDVEYPVEFWANEVVEIIATVEGIAMREARLRFMESLSEYLGYYEIGLTPAVAVDRFWMGGKK